MNVFVELFWSFFKIGAFTFGGGYAMIPLISEEIIETHGWLTLEEFVDIIAIAEMTPGPISVNSATFVGYKIAGVWGSIASTLGVVLPSFIVITIMAAFLKRFWDSPVIQGGLVGIRSAVFALVLYAAYSVGRVAFTSMADVIIALAILISLLSVKMHPILCIVMAGAMGILKGLFF